MVGWQGFVLNQARTLMTTALAGLRLHLGPRASGARSARRCRPGFPAAAPLVRIGNMSDKHYRGQPLLALPLNPLKQGKDIS